MNEQENPFASPQNASIGPVESQHVNQQPTGIHPILWLLWFAGLLCIPVMLYFEESTIQNGNPDYRLGRIALAPLAAAFVAVFVLPWFARTTIRRRAAYFLFRLLPLQ